MGSERCCCWGCTVTTDDFDGGNSTNIGPKWDEDADHETHGQWRRFDQKLQESGFDAATGTPGASIITTKEGDQKYMGVHAYRRNSGVGVKHRWLGNILDRDNYLFAQAEDIDANWVTITLWKREGGVDNLLVTKTRTWFPNAENGFQVRPGICLSPSSFTFSAPDGTPVWYCVDDPADFYFEEGFKAGLGNGGDEVVIFDDFIHYNFQETNTEAQLLCCGQQCQCGSPGHPDRKVCLPERLLLTLRSNDDEEGCYELDGLEIDLAIVTTGSNHWEYVAEGTPDDFPFGVDWVFECATSVCNQDFSSDEFSLRTTPTGENCPYDETPCLEYYEGAVSVTCDPFLVVFPEIEIPPPTLGGPCEYCDQGEGTVIIPGHWWAEVSIPAGTG